MKIKSLINIKLGSKYDFLRLRNIMVSKLFQNSSMINRFINYKVTEKEISCTLLKSKLIDISKINDIQISDNICYVADMCLKRRMNILGSGWVDCSPNFTPVGLLGTRFPVSIKGKSKNQYILWNYDVKTGYKWEEKYIGENEYSITPENVDIKNPWELGRMNYLSSLALAAIRKRESRKEYLNCFKNIVIDFDLHNPPCKGINWILAMEASIRITNILFAYDILSQVDSDEILDKEFEKLILRMTIQHVRFIYNNLEKSIFNDLNGNHYYSDLAGLLMCYIYLEKYGNSLDKIFSYAINEFFSETKKQFFLSGGNFEHSSGYFNLTGEMLAFVIAGLLRKEISIPDDIVKILYGNLELIYALRGKDGGFFKFGDCDSGRFIKTEVFGKIISTSEACCKYLSLKGYDQIYAEESFLDEDNDNYSSLIGYLEGLLNQNCNYCIEQTIISLISNGKQLELHNKSIDYGIRYFDKKNTIDETKCLYSTETKIKIEPCLEIVRTYANLDLGLIVYEWETGKIFFYIGNNNNKNGHSHNDSLHFEINSQDKWLFCDRGTFSYTGTKEYRNYFRGNESHNVPHHKTEQKEMSDSFSYTTEDFREVKFLSDNEVIVEFSNNSYTHYRRLLIEHDMLVVSDYSNDRFDTEYRDGIFSNGYGKLLQGGI